jgi:hypothetical protein
MQNISARKYFRHAIQVLICALIIISCAIKYSSESSSSKIDGKAQTATYGQQAIQTADSYFQTDVVRQQEFKKVFTPVFPPAQIGDGGLLSKQPCGPPCFMGFSPDVTTKTEVFDFFKNKVDINQCHIWDHQKEAGDEGIICNPIEVTFQKSGLVDYIRYSPSTQITVKDILKSYGEPDGVRSVSDGDDTGKILSVYMELYYNQINTKFDLEKQQNTIFELNETNPVIQITYSTNIEFDKDLEFTEPWLGFGKYEPIMHLEGGDYP